MIDLVSAESAQPFCAGSSGPGLWKILGIPALTEGATNNRSFGP